MPLIVKPAYKRKLLNTQAYFKTKKEQINTEELNRRQHTWLWWKWDEINDWNRYNTAILFTLTMASSYYYIRMCSELNSRRV